MPEYKVVNINSPYQIVLNCGQNYGIKNGDKFEIFALGEVIHDPDTGEELEQLEIIRGEGIVTHVQNKICTIDSCLYERKPVTTKQTPLFSSFGITGTQPTEKTEIITEAIPFCDVQIGDQARKLPK